MEIRRLKYWTPGRLHVKKDGRRERGMERGRVGRGKVEKKKEGKREGEKEWKINGRL